MLRMVIDPGHGNCDVGMVAPDGRKECDMAYRIAAMLQDKYVDQTILLTRSLTSEVSLYDRLRIIQNDRPHLTLSLHLEPNNDQTNRYGVGIYYFFKDGESGSLARIMSTEFQKNMRFHKIRTYPSNFYLVRKSKYVFVVRLPYLLKIANEKVDIEIDRFCDAVGEVFKRIELKS
jgi:N-acetylmuramoyl-L-alanine amidase